MWARRRNDFCDEVIVATVSAAQQLKFPISDAEDLLYRTGRRQLDFDSCMKFSDTCADFEEFELNGLHRCTFELCASQDRML
jgi:hypothetical protein